MYKKINFTPQIGRMFIVVLSRRNLYYSAVFAIAPAILVLAIATPGYGIPMGEPFLKLDNQGADQQELGYKPMNPVTPPTDLSLHPNLTPFINEAHPYPDYIKKFNRGGQFPQYYLDLLKTAPVNQVQSKVFDRSAFKNMHVIGVAGFENKTAKPFKDESAGYVIANQISQELQSYEKYRVIPPPRTSEDARLKITKTPHSTSPEMDKTQGGKAKTRFSRDDLPLPKKKVDAVLIGAVTRYVDSFVDRRGKTRESISSGVEFGAYLVNAKTGDVLWGARYVGTQTPNILGFLEGETHWLSKEELSRSAMKKVLKAFREVKNQ
jgi:hypothetical protein